MNTSVSSAVESFLMRSKMSAAWSSVSIQQLAISSWRQSDRSLLFAEGQSASFLLRRVSGPFSDSLRPINTLGLSPATDDRRVHWRIPTLCRGTGEVHYFPVCRSPRRYLLPWKRYTFASDS